MIIDRVVTTQSLDAALTDRTKQIEVQRGAVVTPSARDLLRDRNLSLVETATSRSHATIWIGIDGHLPQNTLRWIYARGQDVAPSGELQQQLQWLENKLADHQSVALIVSDRSMRAAAVANRRPALRAAAIRTTGDLKEAHRQMQANVLVACAGSSVDQLTAIAESASMLSRVQHDVADPLRSH